jgi:hypothetical protein
VLAGRGSTRSGSSIKVAQDYLGGETLHALAKCHDISRNLVRIWVAKYEAGAFDNDTIAADIVQAQEARKAALERLVGKLALENEFLKGPRATRPVREARVGPSLSAPWSLGRRRMPADGSRAIDILQSAEATSGR